MPLRQKYQAENNRKCRNLYKKLLFYAFRMSENCWTMKTGQYQLIYYIM